MRHSRQPACVDDDKDPGQRIRSDGDQPLLVFPFVAHRYAALVFQATSSPSPSHRPIGGVGLGLAGQSFPVAGLTVAIPTIVAYNYLSNRAGDIRTTMERAATLVVGWVSQQAKHATGSKGR